MRLVIGAALAAAVVACPASAAQYAFSYGLNGTTIASGTITTDDTVGAFPGSMNVSNVTGSRNNMAITGFQGFFDVDNGDQSLYPTRPSAYVDSLGLTYQVGQYSYNITSPSSASPGGGNGLYTEYRYLTSDPFGPQQSQTVSAFTLTAVPEAATWAMMVGGFGAVGAALRRNSRTSVRFG